MNVSIWKLRIQGLPDTGVSMSRENSSLVTKSIVCVGNYTMLSTAGGYGANM